MKLSIVTPCFNASDCIQRCINSVADQRDVAVEHIIQDGGSCDGTVEKISAIDSGAINLISEPDRGMYDALNKGFDRATGDIFAHINSDEQYLPGALGMVSDFFDNNPDVDIQFTDVLVLRDDASFVCYQKVIKPTRSQILLSHLPTYTAGTFFRRKVWEDGMRFDASMKALGDSVWMLGIIKKGYSMACLHCYTTAVTATENNLSLSPVAQEESCNLFAEAGRFAAVKRGAQIIRYRLSKLANGCYRQSPLSYSVYTKNSLLERKTYTVEKPSPFWMQMHNLKSLNYYIDNK